MTEADKVRRAMLEDAGAFISIGDLTPDPRNARAHTPRNIGMIETALNEVGAARSIVIDEDGVVLAGNATIEAAAQAGIEKVQVVEADGNTIIAVRRSGLTPEQKTRLALFDNRAAELADWDAGVLAALAEETDLSQLFRDDELAALLAQEAVDIGGAGDEFDTTPQDGPTRTQAGDLWIIGGVHRLLVGDCTDAANVERLMGGERAAICFTSPPYNAGVSAQLRGNTHLDDSLYADADDNLDAGAYLSLLGAFTQSALEHCQYVFVNVQPLAGNKIALVEYQYAFRDHLADIAIWNKGHAAPLLARRVMNSQFEYILVFSGEDNPSRSVGTSDWRGTVSNVYDGPPQRNNEYAEIHGATMPLHFPMWICETFTNRGELVYEPFAGTGTTLIAAHQTGRRCYGMEISPRYADVILRRAEAAGLSCERDG